MVTQAMIDRFFNQDALAVAGVSRDSRKFGYSVYKELKQKGYRVYPLNPNTAQIGGDACYACLEALPEKVGGMVVVVPPEKTLDVINEAIRAGVKHVWLQPGAESPQAIELCNSNGIEVIHDECIMMFAGKVKFPHNIHRWVNRVSGKLPK